MKFTIDDLTNIKNINNRLVFTSSFIKPVNIVMASCLHNYSQHEPVFQYQEQYAENMCFKNPISVEDDSLSLTHSKAIKLKDKFDNDRQTTKIINILEKNSNLDSGTRGALDTVLAEVFQNSYAHSESKQPPICCVQDWSSSDFLEIAVADSGIGIKASLGLEINKYPNIDNYCKLACDSGVSGKLHKVSLSTGTTHGGFGLFFLKRFIQANRGKLFLASGDRCYNVGAQHERDSILPYYWNGTIVRLIINKTTLINTEALFKSIAKEQEGGLYDENY